MTAELTPERRKELLEESQRYEAEAKRLQAKADKILNKDKERTFKKPPSNPRGRHGREDLMRDYLAGQTQCTARSKQTGQRCRNAPALGSNVCRSHGSEAPQTKAKAQRRLQQASDVLVQRLLSFALDGEVADPVAMQAINSALDRAGFTPKQSVEIGIVKPYERIIEQMERGGSRAEYRRSKGIPDFSDQQALPPVINAEIDAEVEEDWLVPRPSDDYENGLEDDLGPLGPPAPPAGAAMSFEEAVSAQHQQRALPRGRT